MTFYECHKIGYIIALKRKIKKKKTREDPGYLLCCSTFNGNLWNNFAGVKFASRTAASSSH